MKKLMRNADLPILSKLALIPEILKAADVLHFAGLIKMDSHEVVREYIKANPDIKKHIENPANYPED